MFLKQPAELRGRRYQLIGAFGDFLFQKKMKPPVDPGGIDHVRIFHPFVPEIGHPGQTEPLADKISDQMAGQGAGGGVNGPDIMATDQPAGRGKGKGNPADLFVRMKNNAPDDVVQPPETKRIKGIIDPGRADHERAVQRHLPGKLRRQVRVRGIIPVRVADGKDHRVPAAFRKIFGQFERAQGSRSSQGREIIGDHQHRPLCRHSGPFTRFSIPPLSRREKREAVSPARLFFVETSPAVIPGPCGRRRPWRPGGPALSRS